jgi:hypothetical protein
MKEALNEQDTFASQFVMSFANTDERIVANAGSAKV